MTDVFHYCEAGRRSTVTQQICMRDITETQPDQPEISFHLTCPIHVTTVSASIACTTVNHNLVCNNLFLFALKRTRYRVFVGVLTVDTYNKNIKRGISA